MDLKLGFLQKTYMGLHEFFASLLPYTWLTDTVTVLIALAVILGLSIGLLYLSRAIVVTILTAIARRTKFQWDDKILARRVVHKLCHMLPALFIYVSVGLVLPPEMAGLLRFLRVVAALYMTLAALLALNAFLNALHDIYLELPISATRPIKPYVQLVQIIVFLFGGIIMISIIVNKSPLTLLLGLSALAAVFMLVFKDSILGLAASVQASANNMVKPGDWIVMPSREADGTVLEITLNTVKVQNWDRTIVTFPTYALVSESCTNWKGMEESDGRRIKRSVYIDARSVHFCTPEELDHFERIGLLRDYIRAMRTELEKQNQAEGFDQEVTVNGRRLTNIGVFRKYVNIYLEGNELISPNGTYMARLLQPTPQGIPLEVYCFSRVKEWVAYEGVQSDIFDHLYAILPEFNLRAFQVLSGSDFADKTLNRIFLTEQPIR